MVSVKQVVIGILLWSFVGVSNEKFEFSSSISKSKIYQNEIITLTLAVTGSDKDVYKNITQPNLSNIFTVVSTSQSSSFSYGIF